MRFKTVRQVKVMVLLLQRWQVYLNLSLNWRSKLHQLEKLSAQNGDQQIQHLRALNQHQGELAFEAEPDALREAIEQLDPDELSPKQALAYLYQLKKML